MLELAQRLAAYIPTTLTRHILAEGLPTPGTPHSLTAATLFSDISGFTAMSEELASDGPRGAEELNRVLLTTFTAMIDVIHDLGGAVSHFYGDAMSVYFPDEDGQAARRALICAQAMQKLMLTSFDRVVTNRPPGKDPFFRLTIKIGVGYGRCQELIVGDPAKTLEFVLTGPAVDEAAAAEKHATSGQVVASQHVLQQAGLPTTADFQPLVTSFKSFPLYPLLNWQQYDPPALQRLITYMVAFTPPALYERLMLAGGEDLAEHRPVTSMFVQFEYAGDTDETSAIETADMGAKLQQYYQWASQVVARFGSQNARVNRILTGDKGNQLHIMFGAPIAPDAPDQALRCALALQRERPEFITNQKIGLAVGKVFAGPVGSSARREYTVVGDIVNLSARLMQICSKNSVYTSQTTAERARDLIDFEMLPAVPLKGKQIAVVPYRAVGEHTTITQLQVYFSESKRPLVGRDDELDLLLGGMDAALRGVAGVSAILGSVGVGKTRLLAAGVKYWLDFGGAGLAGVCHQHTTDNPFNPWQSIWRDFFGLHTDMELAAQVQTVVQRTRALVPDCGDDVGLWGEGLGLPISQSTALEELTAAARQSRFFMLVRRCFRAAALEHPLLIVLEDVQWADQTSLALADDLAVHLEDSAIFFAVTYRTSDIPALQMLDRPSCIRILLADLSPRSARQLLHHMIGTAELPPAVEQHLGLRDREGRDSPVSPLFLEEALNVMMGAGVLEVNGRLRVNEQLLTQMQLPDTIHGLLLARLDNLPPANRDLLQVASIIGRQFALEPLHNIVSGIPRTMITQQLAQLSEADMTRLVTADPEWIYLFQHAMTHEVAYESLPYARRQAVHMAVADWLAQRYSDNLRPFYALLAYHYGRADSHDKGLYYALAAANDARDIYANKEAVELYRQAGEHLQALGVEENWKTAVELYLSRATVLRVLGNLTNAMTDAENAQALATAHQDSFLIAQSYNLMAELKYRQNAFEESHAFANRVIQELKTAVSANELAPAYHWSGMSAGALGDYDLALSALHKAEQLCIATHNNFRLALALEATAFVYYSQKKLDLALQAMQRSVSLSRNFSTSLNTASALNNIALVQFRLGQASGALATLNEAISLFRDTSLNYLAQALTNRGEVLAYLGQFGNSLHSFEEAKALFETGNIDEEGGMAELYLLWGYEYDSVLGNWQEARIHFEKAQRLIEGVLSDDPELRARWCIGLGQLELKAGKVETAVFLLDEAAQIITERGLSWWLPAARYYQAMIQLKLNNLAQAKTLLVQAMEAVDQEGNPDYLPLILLEMAQLETEIAPKRHYLDMCIQKAETRCRYMDYLVCLKKAGSLLTADPDPEQQAKGTHYVAKATEMDTKKSQVV